MPRFFLDKEFLSGATAVITGEDAAHIAFSLRMAAGERVTLCDGEGYDYHGIIESVSKDTVTVSLTEKIPSVSEPPYAIRLYQCLPKGEKFESIIQKAVESGVTEIIPVQSSRCIALMKDSAAEKKLLRFNRIAKEAAKQSGRGALPKVLPPVRFKDAVKAMGESEIAFLCYENEEGLTLKGLLEGKDTPASLAFLVGPEGGLSAEEVVLAREAGIPAVSLGNRILRTETAAPFVLAVLCARFEL